MTAAAPAGLFFLNGSRVPDLGALDKMVAARSKTVIHGVLNEAVMIDRSGTAQADWGTPISEDVCAKMIQGGQRPLPSLALWDPRCSRAQPGVAEELLTAAAMQQRLMPSMFAHQRCIPAWRRVPGSLLMIEALRPL